MNDDEVNNEKLNNHNNNKNNSINTNSKGKEPYFRWKSRILKSVFTNNIEAKQNMIIIMNSSNTASPVSEKSYDNDNDYFKYDSSE